ncbi:MAG: indolepyruvate ferredoxin oxidoreductase [Phycisphaerales bacterium]|nr:indolepyruvate ferredoxin oxidoreductase [Phycisphaerales bacterium]
MDKPTDPRFLCGSGVEAFDGNELLFKGALETEGGVHLLTGYPGSPVATFFDVIADCATLLRERGIEGRMANNEALAVASVNGTQMAPLRAMVVFKSVGLHVASDALALGNLAGPHPEGGAVVVVGDDPWSESTQVPADSRFLLRHLFVPILEPGTPQEIKDFVGAGFALSRAADLYIGYIITTTLADGGGTVQCRPNHYPLTNTNHPFDLQTLALNLEKTVLLPPRTGRSEKQMPERQSRLFTAVEQLGLNRLADVPGADELLLVTSGMAYQYVYQALADFGLVGQIPLLKLDVTWPLDPRRFEGLLNRFRHVLVIEERRSFIEEQIADIAVRLLQRSPRPVAHIWGKQFPSNENGLPSALGLNVSIVTDRLGRFLQVINPPAVHRVTERINQELATVAETARVKVDIPPRTPTFCPGCPHRDSASLLLDIKNKFTDRRYMRKHHRREPVDLVFHGDTGCYTMLLFEPNTQLMHNYSGMGLGGGTGSGIDPFIRNKQVVFMGDGTFFHSGTSAISNSLFSRQDITYIILQNDTTAMTGHQPLASMDRDLMDRPVPAQDIERIVRAITGEQCLIVRADPGDRENYHHTLERVILKDGVKIVIADKECGIISNRRKMRAERAEQHHLGYIPRKIHMNVTPEVCEFCLECSNSTGCPGLTVEKTDYGPKMATDLSWCVNDGACAKIGACPAFEEVIVTRKRPPRMRGHQIMLEDIPEPAIDFKGDIWRAWLAGVGGMGIGTAAAILVIAGRHEGYNVQFSDKKGLAIRNGSVYSQLIFTKNDTSAAMTVGYGKADLLLGVDLLEAVRAIDPKAPWRVASRERTAVVVNTDRTPTIRTLMGLDDFRIDELEHMLRQATRPDRFFSCSILSLCERIFGTKLYANITMLGVAYQRGLIPVSLESLKEGIRQTIKADFKKNLRALNLGRKLVTHPELFFEVEPAPSLARTVREKAAYLNLREMGTRKALRSDRPGAAGKRRLPDKSVARTYKHMVYTTLRACRELDRQTMQDIAVRVYDLVEWGGVRYAQRYVQRIRRVFLADHESRDFAATRAVVWNLARLMLIKDEFYVAELLTSYEKLRRDRQRYNVNPSNGDRIRYRRTFHPRILGKQVDIRLPHWGLYLLRNLRFLRRVMPLYRHKERRFLKWYEQLVDRFEHVSEADYAPYIEALRAVESVKGFAEIRWPKMDEARRRVKQILATTASITNEKQSPLNT